MVKNWAAFSPPWSQFFTVRTDPRLERANNMFIFFPAVDYKWVCLRNFVIERACAPSTNDL